MDTITIREAIIAGTHCDESHIDATNAIAVYRKGVAHFEAHSIDIDQPIDEETACEIVDEFFRTIFPQH